MWKKLIASTSTTRSHRHPYVWSFSSATTMSLPLRSIHKNTNEISSAMRIRRASSFSPSSLQQQQQQQQLLECPHCRAPLVRHSHSQHNKQYSYQCANNHSFDVAKQGYTNLVLVQHKKSKEPGDPADMVRARTRFLSSGLYEPVSDAVNDMIRKTCLLDRSRSNDSLVIDAGCGEGYYTSRLEQALLRDNYDNAFTTMPTMAAFDISKFAVRWAAANARTTHQNKDNKNDYSHIQWFVANSMDLPVATERCDVLMSLFAPLSATEFGRILKPKGHLVVASAGEDHLMELRQLLYGDTERPKSSKMKNVLCSSDRGVEVEVEEEAYPRNKLVPPFALVSEKIIRHRIQLDDATILKDLLGMTPYQWRSSPTQQATILSSPQQLTKEQLSFTVHVRLQAFQKL